MDCAATITILSIRNATGNCDDESRESKLRSKMKKTVYVAGSKFWKHRLMAIDHRRDESEDEEEKPFDPTRSIIVGKMIATAILFNA